MLPDFLIIGAPRSGTDFLFHALSEHPDVCMTPTREVHFFDYNYEKGRAWYERFFSGCNPTYMIGEKTANYLGRPQCAQRIKDTLDDPKLIVILRDPVDRVYSHYRNHIGWRAVDPRMPFRIYLEEHPEVLEMGNYHSHLNRYFNIFNEANIYVTYFETFFKDPQHGYSEILHFLGIKETALPIRGMRNEARKLYKIGALDVPQGVINGMRKYLPHFAQSVLLRSMEYACPELRREDKVFLDQYYADQNTKLKELLISHKGGSCIYE